MQKKKLGDYFVERAKKLKVHNKTSIAPFPKNALVELTNACNHECIFCHNPLMKRSISDLTIDTFKDFVINGVKNGLEEVGLYSTGEPFMTKNLEDYIKVAKKSGIKRVYITTNGALAKIEKVKKCISFGLDSIKFSINAGSSESYKKIHGYDDFEKVSANVKDIWEYKKKNNLNLKLLSSFVITKITANEVDNFKTVFSKYFDDMDFLHPINQGGRTDEVKKAVENEITKKSTYTPCEMLWNRLHLTAEGSLTACCVDYENDLVYEKFDNKKSLKDQFNSDKIVYLRKKHLDNNLENTICKNCIYGTNEKYEKLSALTNNDIKFKLIEKKRNKIEKRLKSIVDQPN
jgi:MoaA/NifB/PqqE/SkfB family radical SAM enzyme